MSTDWLDDLCAMAGVASRYTDITNREVQVSRETRIAVLSAMGLDAADEARATAQLAALKADAEARWLPQEVIVDAHNPGPIHCAVAAEWQLEAEGTGQVLASGQGPEIALPPMPIGIHILRVSHAGQDQSVWILARPAQAVQVTDRVPEGLSWGVTSALYGMTDGGRQTLGTYPLLGRYAGAMARHGADFLGINPVHGMGFTRPGDVISPYSPSHRAFLNTWHVDVPGQGEAVPTAADGLLAYGPALAAKAGDLAADFAQGDPSQAGFAEFVAQGGPDLQQYALFEALADRFGADWQDWPAAYRDHDPQALAEFARAEETAVMRNIWAQWRAETQLAEAQAEALSSGMRIGLYLDLAVGPRKGGAETWVEGSALAAGISLGAPPDPLCPAGQNWGLAPLSPILCRQQGYAGFAALLRAVMRHAGMIRIDHALGLMRSFWVPDGGQEGAYVSYPLEALLAVVAIESVRNGTIVIGEDLGLVPDGLRSQLAASGIYGMDILQYQRTPEGGFADTRHNRHGAICAFATHDTPTIKGFFAGEDAHAQERLGVLDAPGRDHILADRARAADAIGDVPVVAEIHQRLALSSSALVAVQLDDIAQRTDQQNLPGTVEGYPNWRREGPYSVEEISGSCAFAELGRNMKAQGRGTLCASKGEL